MPTNDLVKLEKAKLSQLLAEFENTKLLRDQILTEAQRVYMPSDMGVTG